MLTSPILVWAWNYNLMESIELVIANSPYLGPMQESCVSLMTKKFCSVNLGFLPSKKVIISDETEGLFVFNKGLDIY